MQTVLIDNTISCPMENIIAVVLTEVLMTAFISYLIFFSLKRRNKFTYRDFSIAVIALSMMASMLDSITYYLAFPVTFLNAVIALNISMFEMSIAVIYLLWLSFSKKFIGYNRSVSNTLIFLIVFNEISMGIFLRLIGYGYYPTSADYSLFSNVLSVISSSLNSYLFIIPMVAEMAVIIAITVESSLNRLISLSIMIQSIFSPTFLGNESFVLPGIILGTGSMVIFMIIFYERISKGRTSLFPGDMTKMRYIFLLYTLMSTSIFIGTLYHSPFYVGWVLYGIAMVTGMLFYLHIHFPIGEPDKKRTGWIKNPRFVFLILLTSFISEWLLAAAIEFQAYAPFFETGFQNLVIFSNMLGGVTVFTSRSIIVDIFYILGAVANYYIFLAIMGIEMGVLVLFRMKSIQWKEKRVNLALALIAFALYTTIYPNFIGNATYSKLPLWANVGALAPLYPYMIAALLGSYALYAVLALLFGRRSYCSTLCPSAVMYGGSLGQSMIAYNYESEFSRKNIGSRFKGWVISVISSLWVIMIVVSFLSYITASKLGSFNLYGIDVSVYFSFFIWNFLWYVFFISIPFVGMSPCRRYGWCTTGTFVGFFSKLGLFKLKVKEPATCVTCPTKDCVSACEVGLGDLAGQFIKTGEFKSTKCVGAGSCLEACPYDNIFFYDIRNYLKERKTKN